MSALVFYAILLCLFFLSKGTKTATKTAAKRTKIIGTTIATTFPYDLFTSFSLPYTPTSHTPFTHFISTPVQEQEVELPPMEVELTGQREQELFKIK